MPVRYCCQALHDTARMGRTLRGRRRTQERTALVTAPKSCISRRRRPAVILRGGLWNSLWRYVRKHRGNPSSRRAMSNSPGDTASERTDGVPLPRRGEMPLPTVNARPHTLKTAAYKTQNPPRTVALVSEVRRHRKALETAIAATGLREKAGGDLRAAGAARRGLRRRTTLKTATAARVHGRLVRAERRLRRGVEQPGPTRANIGAVDSQSRAPARPTQRDRRRRPCRCALQRDARPASF